MIYFIYSMRDSATRQFTGLTLSLTDDEAIRNFDYAVMNTGTIKFNPGDFALYKLGCYDTEKGALEAYQPECIRLGTESEVAYDDRI